jgi:hypothetical protein
MARRGVYAHRNQAHRAHQAAFLEEAAARGSWEELAAAFGVFRAAVKLLIRRRPPLGTPPGVHEAQAEALTRQVIAYLRDLAGRIDAGDFDARKVS